MYIASGEEVVRMEVATKGVAERVAWNCLQEGAVWAGVSQEYRMGRKAHTWWVYAIGPLVRSERMEALGVAHERARVEALDRRRARRKELEEKWRTWRQEEAR